MARALLAHLLDASLRSVLLALLAVVMLLPIRRRCSPAIFHFVWSGVLAAMLCLFALGPVLPRLPLRVLRPAGPDRLLLTATSASPAIPPAPVRPESAGWPEAAFLLYAAVALASCGKLLAGSWLARRLLLSSTPICDAAALALAGRLTGRGRPCIYESAAVSVPLTVGCLRPAILLPAAWRSWNAAKLRAVLSHEAAHVRRLDALVILLAGLNRCAFWFHPLAWWIERKLGLLAEQACDAVCLAAIGDRKQYANLLLEMAGAMASAGGRVSWRALGMAGPSHIRRRIEALLDAQVRPAAKLATAAWVAILISAMPLVFAATAIRLEPRPPLLVLALPMPGAPAPPADLVAPAPGLPRAAERADRDLYSAVEKEADPHRRLALLNALRTRYPHTKLNWLQLALNTYSQLNDIPNVLAALNEMGKEEFIKTLPIHPPADGDASPAKVSKALFYYARAATYAGPGSLAPEGRQQLDDYLRKTYNSIFGQNEVGLDELKRLAKSYPFPPQYFNIALLPPPNRTFDSSLATVSSSIHIRNQCPYDLRIDCSGPQRKRTWIPSGQDSQIVVTPGTYQIYAADVNGVSSFTGPGRFDPQFDYAYTLSLKRD